MNLSNSQTSPSEKSAAEAGGRAEETYRQLKNAGLSDTDIMAFAGELLSLVATGVRSQAAAE